MSEETTRYCPFCLSDNVATKGVKKSEAKGPNKPPPKPVYKCKRCNRSSVAPLTEDDPRMHAGKHTFRTTLSMPRKEKYVITCAQNATDAHPVLETLKSYCAHNDAELLIIPIRYQTPLVIGVAPHAHRSTGQKRRGTTCSQGGRKSTKI